VDARCRVLAVVLTPGQAGDNPRLIALVDQITLPAGRRRRAGWLFRVIADKAYSARGTRRYLRSRRIAATIPEKKDQLAHRKNRGSRGGRPYAFDTEIYKRRNVVERAIARLKQYRALASRYAKRAVIYRAQILFIAALTWLS
jgi:transposase